MTPPADPRPAVAIDDPERPSAAALAARDRLRARPRNPWRSRRGPERGLAYTLVVEHDLEQFADLRALVDVPWLLNERPASVTRLRVLQGQDRWRAEIPEDGYFSCAFGMMQDGDAGLVFLDPKSRAFLHLDPGQLPPVTRSPRVPTEVRQGGEEDVRGRRAQAVTVEIRGRRALRWEAWMCGDADLQPFARGVLAFVAGGSDHLAPGDGPLADLARLGVPLRGGLTFLDAPAGRPAMRFHLDSLAPQDLSDEDFTTPDGWHDLHDGPVQKPAPPSHGGGSKASPQKAPRPTDETPPGLADRLQLPACQPATYGSGMAASVRDDLLRDVRFFLNEASRRLRKFEGNQGKITIDWLEQLRQFMLDGGEDDVDRDGWYSLLHEEPGQEPPDPIKHPHEGRGLLDRMARRAVRRLLLDGTLVGGALGGLSLPPALNLRVGQLVLDPAVSPESRWDRLDPDAQVRLREAYLAQRLAAFKLTYKTTTKMNEELGDLVRWRLIDFRFHVDIYNHPIVDSLEFGPASDILLDVSLPNVTANAGLERWPGVNYGIVAGLGAITCFLLPGFCPLVGGLIAATLFLTFDLAPFQANLKNFRLKFRLAFNPDAQGVLQPDVSVTASGTPDVFTMSGYPDLLHQVVSIIIIVMENTTNDVADAVADQIRDELKDALTDVLALFPPVYRPVERRYVATFSTSQPQRSFDARTWLHPDLAKFQWVGPFKSQADVDPLAELLSRAPTFTDAYPGPRVHWYGGFALSQNFLNDLLAALWYAKDFLHVLPPPELQQLRTDLQSKTDFDFGDRIEARLWPAAIPRFQLTERDAAEGKAYAVTHFDDVRLCVRGRPDDRGSFGMTAEFQFAARAACQIGFGAVDGGQANVVSPAPRFCDLYFDRAGLALTVPESQAVWATGDAAGKITSASLASLQTVLRQALVDALANRDDGAIPRDKTATGDPRPPTFQRYRGTGLPTVCRLVPARGHLYTYWGLDGFISSGFGADVLVWDLLPTLTAFAAKLARNA